MNRLGVSSGGIAVKERPVANMSNRFCASCGARLLPNAVFCVECGAAHGAPPARRLGVPAAIQRYAPVLVVLVTLAVTATAVFVGRLNPKTPPQVPGRGAGPDASGNLPPGHPPIAVPDTVKQALQDLQKKADAAPDDLETWKRLGEAQYRAAQLDPTYLAAADRSYQHLLEREPNNTEILRTLGNIAFDRDEHAAAVDFYQRYLKLKPEDLNVQTDLGTMYLSDGKPDQAVRQYQLVLKQDPSFFQAQFNMAIAYRALGQTEKVVPALEKARELAKDEQTRQQVDQLLARAKNGSLELANEPSASAAPPESAPAAQPQAAAAPPAGAGGGSFQADAEAIFREHPIVGAKLQRIEWSGPESAKVYLNGFPVDQMPPDMLNMFNDRMKTRIKEKKDAHHMAQTARFELVDAASGKVMDTITE